MRKEESLLKRLLKYITIFYKTVPVMMPNNLVVIIWNLLLLFVIIYNIGVIPIEFAF